MSRDKSIILLSVYTAARVMLKYIRASCPYIQMHVENGRESQEHLKARENGLLQEMHRVQSFSLPNECKGLFNVMVKFTTGLDDCSAQP